MADAQGDVSYYQSLIGSTKGRMNEIRAKQAAAEAVLADLDVAILETNTAISFTELEISQKEAELARTSAVSTPLSWSILYSFMRSVLSR